MQTRRFFPQTIDPIRESNRAYRFDGNSACPPIIAISSQITHCKAYSDQRLEPLSRSSILKRQQAA
jgi:hypothetical protein